MLERKYINYIIEGNYNSIEELTSYSNDKYNKIINILLKYKEEYINLNNNNDVLTYTLSKIDKRYKFKESYIDNKSLILILKIYRDIEFTGATSISLDDIKREFKNYIDIEKQIEEMKKEGYLYIESRADLYQIRFKEF